MNVREVVENIIERLVGEGVDEFMPDEMTFLNRLLSQESQEAFKLASQLIGAEALFLDDARDKNHPEISEWALMLERSNKIMHELIDNTDPFEEKQDEEK